MSHELLSDYLPIIVFLGIATGLALAMLLASFIIGKQKPDSEKLSAYECGFDAFSDTRSKFDVRWRSCSSSLIWKWPSCFRGRCRLAQLAFSVSGR